MLADLDMPGMDQFELARYLRAVEAEDGGARKPIIAVTANAMRGQEERSLAAGMDSVNRASPSATHEGSSNVVRWRDPHGDRWLSVPLSQLCKRGRARRGFFRLR